MKYFPVAVLMLASISRSALIPEEHPLFQPDTVNEIRIYFQDDDFWGVLHENYADEEYLSADFVWDGYTLTDVGVRFKGGSSYMNNHTMKKSFKIDFDVFVEDQNLDGIYKINLNCNFNDPSFVREAAAYSICSEAGVPCSRTSFAALYINDTYWGLYTVVEQFDKHFIEARFGSSEDGNLWKGDDHGTLEFLGWEQVDYYTEYELKTNEAENDWSTLIACTYSLNNTPVELLPDTLSEHVDVNTALLLLATDNLLVNLDSYSGRGVNYYLYHLERDQRFVFGQWDLNESWGCYNSWGYSTNELHELDVYWTNPTVSENRPLADVLWNVDEYREVYLGHIRRIVSQDANPDYLIPEMEQMRDLIRDWVYLEEHPRSLFTPEQFEQAMYSDVQIGPNRFAPALATFVESRYDYLVGQLGELNLDTNLVLNELMAGNDSTVADEYGEFDDWVELVNTGSAVIDLSSFSLTDDMAFPHKFTFPDTSLAPGEYLLLWLDNDTDQGSMHAGFKLSGSGEDLYLLHEYVIVDEITYPEIDDDESWGRWPDLGQSWCLQAYPTPGAPNSDDPPEEEWEGESTLSIVASNPVRSGSASVVISGTGGEAQLNLFDLAGRRIALPFSGELIGEHSFSLEMENLPAGVYILQLIQSGQMVTESIAVIR